MIPPHPSSRRAAIRALLAIRDKEAQRLREIIDYADSAGEAKQAARDALAMLKKITLLRIAEIEQSSELKVERPPEPPALAPSIDTPTPEERVSDPEAA